MNRVNVFKIDGRYCVFDGESMNSYLLPDKMNSGLDSLSREEIIEIFGSVNPGEKKAERLEFNRNICQRLIINISGSCNLGCRYCYAKEGKYGKEITENMTEETLINAVNAVIRLFPEGIRFIQFFGGEPLLNKKLLYKSISIINSILHENGLTEPKYGMVTNGTLLDDESIDFIVSNFESITISLDGKKNINDYNRVQRGNNHNSVYDQVKEAIGKIRERSKTLPVCCEATISRAHIEDFRKNRDVNSFYDVMKMGFDYFQIAPVFGCDSPDITLEGIDREEAAEYFTGIMCRAFYRENGEIKPYLPSRKLYECLRDKVIPGNGCGANKGDICIDVRGDIYPCFMFIGNEDFYIGNVNSFDYEESSGRRRLLVERMNMANENEKCRGCWAKSICGLSYSHCIGTKQIVNGDISKPVDLNCEISKAVLERLIYEMIQVAQACRGRDKNG